MTVSTNNKLFQFEEFASLLIRHMKEFVSNEQQRLSQSRGLVYGTLDLSNSDVNL